VRWDEGEDEDGGRMIVKCLVFARAKNLVSETVICPLLWSSRVLDKGWLGRANPSSPLCILYFDQAGPRS